MKKKNFFQVLEGVRAEVWRLQGEDGLPAPRQEVPDPAPHQYQRGEVVLVCGAHSRSPPCQAPAREAGENIVPQREPSHVGFQTGVGINISESVFEFTFYS